MTPEERLAALRNLATEQAKNEGLWFRSVYVTEDILQRALRQLHELIEGKTGDECAKEVLQTKDRPP